MDWVGKAGRNKGAWYGWGVSLSWRPYCIEVNTKCRPMARAASDLPWSLAYFSFLAPAFLQILPASPHTDAPGQMAQPMWSQGGQICRVRPEKQLRGDGEGRRMSMCGNVQKCETSTCGCPGVYPSMFVSASIFV